MSRGGILSNTLTELVDYSVLENNFQNATTKISQLYY